MAIVRDFMFAEDDRTGMDGLLPLWFSNADAASEITIPHDMLEHFRDQCGAAEGECEALGAYVLLRLENGAYGNNSPERLLGYEICELLREALVHRSISLPSPIRSHKLSDEHESAEELICAGVRDGFRQFDEAEEGADELRELGDSEVARLQSYFVGWVRRGYRRARRRYAGTDLYTVGTHFFNKVSSEVKRLVSSDMLSRGDRIRISLDPRKCNIGIKVNGHCAYDFGYL